MSEKKKMKLTLNTPANVRITLSRVANMIVNGEIDTKRANTIIYACNSILSSIRTDEQEKRIQKLEEMIRDVKQQTDS